MSTLTGTLRILPPKLRAQLLTSHIRTFTTAIPRLAEGDTGALRFRGQAAADSWTKREKAAEDLYIREHEKTIMKQLKEKIAAQEKILERDREVLRGMEDGYGKAVTEGRG